MTSLERVRAAAAGQPLDRKPVLIYGDPELSDMVVCAVDDVVPARAEHPNQAVLVEVASPFARAAAAGQDIYALLHADPVAGATQLAEYAEQVRDEAALALKAGADGIWYHMEGADASQSTPMQYGGHFLELDRELLAGFGKEAINVVAVIGAEPYLDFVCDLPADFFAWQADISNVDVATVRAIRPGGLAAQSPEADLQIIITNEDLQAWSRDLEAVAK